jgi:hypothetical protein
MVDTARLVNVSTVVAATATLWAVSFAWFTYAMSVRQQNTDGFRALKSIVRGLRVELELMSAWTGAGGQGYSADMPSPLDWSKPNRFIFKFDVGAMSNLTRSPYLHELGEIVEPFARLNLSVSKLFQVYDEYQSFANSDPAIFLATRVPDAHTAQLEKFNRTMHIDLIGGAGSGADCLYKTYVVAKEALDRFEAGLKQRGLPTWFLIGHFLSAALFSFGLVLLYLLSQR